MRPRRSHPLLWPLVAAVVYGASTTFPGTWESALRVLFPGEGRLLYGQATMPDMVGRTLTMVLVSSLLSVTIGVLLGIFVTRPAGADYLDVVIDFSNLGQTFPPIAVFTLAVPLLGFGFEPTILALTVYGVLPVLQNTIAGIRAVPAEMVESAQGMGMSPWQVLTRVELPLAASVILAGIRVSVVINVATSTIGAAAGAGGLGLPIISGLVNQDPAVTLQGAVLTAGLALILDAWLGATQLIVSRRILPRRTDGREPVSAAA